MAFEFIQQNLQHRQSTDLYRHRTLIEEQHGTEIKVAGRVYINFSSNDYLGMSSHGEVKSSWQQGLEQYGCGSGGSPLVTGYTQAHHALEAYLAEVTGREAVLLFNSGFAANSALCQALNQRDSTIVADKLSHASIIDGALSSAGALVRYKHNDMSHLEQKISQSGDSVLLISEGVFSMDGDCAPIDKLVHIASQHKAWLMLDDAHGFGVSGETGLGTSEGFTQGQIPILMATFGKAIGTAGAFVAGSRQLIDYLVNQARHFIYSTAMPPAQATATLTSIQLIQQQPELRRQLTKNIVLFRHCAAEAGIPVLPSETPIQPVMLNQPERALEVSQKLKKQGFWVTAIRPPTVSSGSARLRITLSSAHTEVQIRQLCLWLEKILKS